VFEVLAALCQLNESRPQDHAFSQDDRTLPYAELAQSVGGLSQELEATNANTTAIFAPNGLEWVIADLSVAFAGKTMVPLPTFFSEIQLRHIIQDAGVDRILATRDTRAQAEALGPPVTEVILDGPAAPLQNGQNRGREAGRIIYTSGTTGTPKGVRLGDAQIGASAKGLMAASGACVEDRYLSVLPFSLLLEQVAGIAVPLLVGAPVSIAANAAAAALQGDATPLMNAFEKTGATTSVLVPGLLDAWVKTLAATGNTAPSTLRFVAVGGAPVSQDLPQTAWKLGIPVHEGYGLSECCSVVSVNRPGLRTANTTGQPIPGVTVTLEDGEIVVHGDTVMSGYLGRNDDPGGVWRTGDLGEFTPEGALRVLGRKDNLIVTQTGRNISPEWIESVCEASPDIYKAMLVQVDDRDLVLIVLIDPSSSRTTADITAHLRVQFATLPDYARAEHIAIIDAAETAENELLTPLGDVRRTSCQAFAARWIDRQPAM